MNDDIKNILKRMLKWKGFRNWYYELSEEDQEKFIKDIEQTPNEEI
jgi:hypothetical protein